MDDEEYRKNIEKKILKIIEEKLRFQQMNAVRAKEVAQYILSTLHPHMDIDQIHSVVQQFNDHFSELIPVVIQVSNEYDTRVKETVTKHVESLLKEHKIEAANQLLNKALNDEIKISE